MAAKNCRKSSKKKSAKKTVRKVAKKSVTVKALTKKPLKELEALATKVGKALGLKEKAITKAARARFGKGGRMSGPVFSRRAQREGERSRILDAFEFGAGSGV
jgi:hypothetical protein